MAKSKLSSEEILALIEQEEQQAYGINDAELAKDRAEALSFYLGEPLGNEVEGRSQVVSRDVLDTIETALPQLVKVFVSGDEVIRFDPKTPDDVAACEQETEYVNHVVMEKNPGFTVFQTWIKDALLSKNGYVKVWFEEENEVDKEFYVGLDDAQLALVIKDKDCEVIEHSQYPDEQEEAAKQAQLQQMQQQLQQVMQAAQQGDPNAQQQAQQMQAQMQQLAQMPPKMLHDVKIEVSEKRGCVKIENVAPEDIKVSVDTRTVSVQKSRFVQHTARMSREELEEQGYKVPELAYTEDQNYNEETLTRDLYNEQNATSDLYLVKDTYIRIDGDLMRFIVIGNTIIHEEEAEIIPFAVITPHPMPHRHIGMSYADLTKDVQMIKTALIRGQLDALYLANQPRFGISDRVNLEDMLTSRPGGVVRVQGEPAGAIMPLSFNPPPGQSFEMVAYYDRVKDSRTGIAAFTQSLDPNSLDKTATEVNAAQQGTQARIELVARNIAETGVKELFMLVHRLIRTHYTKPDIVRLRNEWVPVDPRQWKTRTDMTIAVGLGTGNKDKQLAHLSNLFQMAQLVMPMGVVNPENMYNIMRELVINAGFKSPEKFITDPAKMPPQPPQPNPLIQVEQMKQQGKQQEIQATLQADAQKFQAETAMRQQEADKKAQMEMQKFQAQAEIDRLQAEQLMQQEMLRSQNDVQIERDKLQQQAELEKYKAELKAQTDLQMAQMKLESDLQIAQINAEMQARQLEQQALNDARQTILEQRRHEDQIQSANRPKQVLRGPDGRVSGVA